MIEKGTTQNLFYCNWIAPGESVNASNAVKFSCAKNPPRKNYFRKKLSRDDLSLKNSRQDFSADKIAHQYARA
jgi:hypothetical protein